MLPGEEPEEEFCFLVGLGCAGHEEVSARLQPKLPTYFSVCEEPFRPAQGSISAEELWGQFPLVLIAVGVSGEKENGDCGHLELAARPGPSVRSQH